MVPQRGPGLEGCVVTAEQLEAHAVWAPLGWTVWLPGTASAGCSHTGHVCISGDVCMCTGVTLLLSCLCIFGKGLLERDPDKIPAPLWRQSGKVICFSPLFVFKEKVKVKAPVCSWHSKGCHDIVPVWSGVTAQHSIPRSTNIQLLWAI